MNREITIDGNTPNQRQVLGNLTNTIQGNVTNTLGKRPIPFDVENPTLEGNQVMGSEKNASSVAKRRTGNYFSLERSIGFTMENHGTASNNRGSYFSNAMSELGAQLSGPNGREMSPDSELNLEEDYESENDEPLKRNTSCSSDIFSALNSEVLKLGCTGAPEKSCSCSFCIKAAYMWTDLHYQDTRGRLSALKRGRRLARLLEGKLHAQQFNRKVLGGSSKQASNMELELMNQWRSLFVHTEQIFSRETSDLVSDFSRTYQSDELNSLQIYFFLSEVFAQIRLKHSSLLNLEQLRENFKRDLNSVNGMKGVSGQHNG